jgi:hypothetical protein
MSLGKPRTEVTGNPHLVIETGLRNDHCSQTSSYFQKKNETTSSQA